MGCFSSDSCKIKELSGINVYSEAYILRDPVAPYLAAKKENIEISSSDIKIPVCKNLLIEAAGGLLVPVNENEMYIDIIKKTELPVILVARSSLGTINHTCLSIEALKKREINLMGVIVSGEINPENTYAIEKYGETTVLAQLGKIHAISRASLTNEHLSQKLMNILK